LSKLDVITLHNCHGVVMVVLNVKVTRNERDEYEQTCCHHYQAIPIHNLLSSLASNKAAVSEV